MSSFSLYRIEDFDEAQHGAREHTCPTSLGKRNFSMSKTGPAGRLNRSFFAPLRRRWLNKGYERFVSTVVQLRNGKEARNGLGDDSYRIFVMESG